MHVVILLLYNDMICYALVDHFFGSNDVTEAKDISAGCKWTAKYKFIAPAYIDCM